MKVRSYFHFWPLLLMGNTLIAAPCLQPPSGLVSWYSGDGSAIDVYGGSLAVLSTSGISFAPGIVGQCFSFDGTNGYVQTTLDVQPSAMSNCTWEVWVYPTRLNYSVDQTILSDGDGGNDRGIGIQAYSNTFFVNIGNTGSGKWDLPVVADLSAWQHIAVVYSKTNVLFYKNGSMFSFGSPPTGQASAKKLAIGRNPQNTTLFRGMVDEASIYNRALSSQEISAIYSAGSAGKCHPPAPPIQTIDFEALPDGSIPAEGLVISNQFAPFGVTFAFANGTFPLIAKKGSANIAAFRGPSGENTVAANQNVGSYFLTDDGDIGLPPPPLIITYSHPVSSASGVILDIDSNSNDGGNEAWLLEALGASTNVLATNRLTVNSINSGDGKATPWFFQLASTNIYMIRLTYDGAKTNGIGLAFDNFSPGLPIAPAVLAIEATPQAALISISGTPGGDYQLQYSTALSPTNWHFLTEIFLTNAPQQTITDYIASDLRRFYRAVGTVTNQ